jgi:hypothetical protein
MTLSVVFEKSLSSARIASTSCSGAWRQGSGAQEVMLTRCFAGSTKYPEISYEFSGHCERSEAIHNLAAERVWIASSLCSSQ